MNDPGIIERGALAISGGAIVSTGDLSTLADEYDPDGTLDAHGRAIVPGFVEPHTHAIFSGDRLDEFELRIKGAGYLEILEKGGGILSTMRATRASSADELVTLARPRLLSMLAAGITTVEVKTGYGLNLETELRMLAAIERLDQDLPIDLIPTFMPAHAVPPEFEGTPDAYVDLIVDQMVPAAAAWYERSHFMTAGTPFFIDVFCERGGFSVSQARRVLEAGVRHGLKVKAHVDQFTNMGGVAMALELNAVSIDHLDTITVDEVDVIAGSNTVAVLCPAVNLSSGSTQFPNGRLMLDSGVAVALSTDFNPGSSHCKSMPLVMALASRYLQMTPAEALNAVTINAAYAAGIGNVSGSLEAGKRGDMLILESDDYRSLAYEFGGNPVASVIKNGVVIAPA